MVDTLGFGRRKLIESIITQNWKVNPSQKNFNFTEMLFVIQEMLSEEGKPYHEQKFHSPKYAVFKYFTKHLLYRNLANYDSMILITSEKGTGKSSAAIMLAREWCLLLGRKFDPQKHIAYNNSDVMTKIDNLEKFSPLICDEAVRFASAAEWAKKENKNLKIKLAQVRTKHLLYILCYPLKIYKLEKNYLESFTNYWIDLFGRGLGAIYVKDKNPVQDSWRMKEFDRVGSYTEFTNLSKIEEHLKKHPNFWQIIKFPKPPEWLYTRYLHTREANVYDDENVLSSVTKEDIYNALLILALRDILMHDATLSINRILLHISNEYDVRLNKVLVEKAIEEAKQLVLKVKEKAIDV